WGWRAREGRSAWTWLRPSCRGVLEFRVQSGGQSADLAVQHAEHLRGGAKVVLRAEQFEPVGGGGSGRPPDVSGGALQTVGPPAQRDRVLGIDRPPDFRQLLRRVRQEQTGHLGEERLV